MSTSTLDFDSVFEGNGLPTENFFRQLKCRDRINFCMTNRGYKKLCDSSFHKDDCLIRHQMKKTGFSEFLQKRKRFSTSEQQEELFNRWLDKISDEDYFGGRRISHKTTFVILRQLWKISQSHARTFWNFLIDEINFTSFEFVVWLKESNLDELVEEYFDFLLQYDYIGDKFSDEVVVTLS